METKSADAEAQDALLFRGRAGEAVLEAKVSVGNIISILSGFILACSLSEMLALDPSSWSSEGLAGAFVIVLTSSTAFGAASVILFTFLSAKVTRLVGRSAYYLGGHGDADVSLLTRTLGAERLAEYLKEQPIRNDENEVRFPAREWYYPHGKGGGFANVSLTRAHGEEHFVCAIFSVLLQLAFFIVAIIFYLCDRCNSWVAAPSVALIVVIPGIAVARLYSSGAFSDLA